jgi:biotin carboxylase
MNDKSHRPEEPPVILVIATGSRRYREYLLASICTRYRVHLFVSAEPSWERQYVTGWTVLRSTLDAPAMCDAARSLAACQTVSGVLCWDEARILQASHVAEALGLPGGDPAVILRCRDKHLTRTALDAAGIPQPQSVLAAGLDDALAAAEAIGYPVVLKPRALAASLGVVKVATPAELADQFAFAHDTTVPEAPHYDACVLVEEFADGPEISIDCAVGGGEVFPLFVARKELGYAPYFEEVGHYVSASDPLLTDPEMVRLLTATHAALGFTDGMTHVEVKLTGTGPKVIEVNGRLGGDLIPYLGLRATGIDPGLAAASVACGRVPDVTARHDLAGGVRFFYVEEDDTVVGTVGFDARALHPATDLAVALASRGDTASPPPRGTVTGRIAFATAVAPTQQECQTALDAAEAALRIGIGEAAIATGGRP